MKINKVDGRYKGHGNFKYVASFSTSEISKFCEVRAWVWDQWGASCEIDYLKYSGKPFNTKWAWASNEEARRFRIYIATEKEYQWFLLRWS